MNRRKQQRIGCLLALLMLVGAPWLLIWRQMREDRLSAQLMATVRHVKILSEIEYSAEEHKKAQQREIASEQRKVVRLLQEGADPNVRDFVVVKRTFWEKVKFLLKRMFRRSSDSGTLPRSALAMAVQNDDTVLVTALLKAGANDVNAVIEMAGNGYHCPLVNYAAYCGNVEIVKALCAHGADVHRLSQTYDPEKEPILQSALEGVARYFGPPSKERDISKALERQRRTEMYHFLLAQGAKYEPNSKTGYRLLRTAAEDDLSELVRELLAAGVPTNAKPTWLNYRYEFTPLNYAVTNNDIALVKLLLQHSASVGDAHSESAMLYVRSTEMARLLLRHGADIHAVQMHGKYQGVNALNFACGRGDVKVVAFLLEQGLDPNEGGPITEAALHGSIETVRLLLKHGAKVGPKSPGADALYYAVAQSQFDCAKLILRYGAAVNPRPASADSLSYYPLAEAARQDNSEMVLELLKRGAEVNAGKGEALLAACEACDEDLVEILLEHGADPTVRSEDGMTAIQTAKQSADPPGDADGIIALLKEHGAKR